MLGKSLRSATQTTGPLSTTDMEREPWYGSTMSPIDRCDSPESMYCTGKCRDNPSLEGEPSADVVGFFFLFKRFVSASS